MNVAVVPYSLQYLCFDGSVHLHPTSVDDKTWYQTNVWTLLNMLSFTSCANNSKRARDPHFFIKNNDKFIKR